MEEVQVNTSNGSAFGYVAEPGDEQFVNFFVNRDVVGAEPVIEALMRRDLPAAFLCNLNVDKQCRGSGEGTELVNAFMEEAALQDASLIILVCDNVEEQLDGFNLQAWYESLGFEVLPLDGQSSEFPVMVFDGEDDFVYLLEN